MQKRLFHYTTQAGLRGIIENKSLWFTNILFLNDATEFEYTFRKVQEEIEKKSAPAENEKALAHDLITIDMKHFSSYEQLVDIAQNYYVFSFTYKPDDLSQWRAYSDDSGGYCIEFDLNKISKIAAEKEWIRTTCLYDDEKQRERIQNIIDKTYDSYQKEFFSKNALAVTMEGKDIEEERIKWASIFIHELVVLAPQFKHPKFSEEAELRMYTIERMPSRFRQGKTMVIPYLDIKIAESGDDIPIKSIIIGPTNHPKLSKLAVEQLLKVNSIKCEEVKLSDIPYRATL